MISPRLRLEMIASSKRYCGEVVDREGLRAQFYYEVGRNPEASDLDAVLRQVARKAAR